VAARNKRLKLKLWTPINAFWAGQGLQTRQQHFIETAAMPQRSGTGCKPIPAQELWTPKKRLKLKLWTPKKRLKLKLFLVPNLRFFWFPTSGWESIPLSEASNLLELNSIHHKRSPI
jgi:hypothetical protein